MTSLSDTLTVGLVLVLLFGSIALYLYTRIQQSEQKISLLESILLDLKMSSEIRSYNELPASTHGDTSITHNQSEYTSFDDSEPDWFPSSCVNDINSSIVNSNKSQPNSPAPSISSKVDDEDNGDVEQYKSIVAEVVDNIPSEIAYTAESIESLKVSPNYESMTIKELQTLAKSRGITGAGSMKKNSVIEALKTSDRSQPIEPGSLGTSSFLESSSTFQSSAESQ